MKALFDINLTAQKKHFHVLLRHLIIGCNDTIKKGCAFFNQLNYYEYNRKTATDRCHQDLWSNGVFINWHMMAQFK